MTKENGKGSNDMFHILDGPVPTSVFHELLEKHQTCLCSDYVFLKFYISQKKTERPGLPPKNMCCTLPMELLKNR